MGDSLDSDFPRLDSSRPVSSLLLAMLVLTRLAAAEFYVAPDGSDTAAGTRTAPFATVQRAQKVVAPGDTVFIRGGTYRMTEAQIAGRVGPYACVTLLDKSGAPGKRINYWAAPGEQPVF